MNLDALSASGPISYNNTTGHFHMIGGADGQVLAMSGSQIVWENPDVTSNLVTSVFGRIGDISAQAGDYNTTLVTEGTNLYFTDGRAQNALSGTISTINTLSGAFATLHNDFVTISWAFVGISNGFSTLSGTVNAIASEWSSLSGAINTLSGRITAAENNSILLSGAIDLTNTQLGSLSGNVNSLS